MRRRGELAHDPHVVELHHVVPVVARELEPEPQEAPRLQLEVVHGLVGDERAVGVGSERRQDLARVPASEEGVRHRCGPADRGGIDAVQVLEVVADVDEAVEHRLGGRHPGERTDP